jgi:hypothetical protein
LTNCLSSRYVFNNLFLLDTSMRVYGDLTTALQMMLRDWSHGYRAWIEPFFTDPDKLPSLADKWHENYGIRHPAHTRRYRHSKGLPTAVAYAAPVPGLGMRVRVVMLARLPIIPPHSPWAREKWRRDLLIFDDYIISREQDATGTLRWTWKIQDRPFGIWEQDMLRLVKRGDADEVARTTWGAVTYWPMFGGVRRQLRRSLRGAQKLWLAMHKTSCWPGPDPEQLPIINSFRKDGKEGKT